MTAQGTKAFNTALSVVAVLIWSSAVGVGRGLSEHFGPLTTASLVFLIGGITGCAVELARGTLVSKARRANPRYVVFGGAAFVLYAALFYLALGLATDHTALLGVGLFNYLWPMMVVVLSIPVLGKGIRPLLWPGLALSLCGLYLAVQKGGGLSLADFMQSAGANRVPFLLAGLAAVSWGLFSNFSRKWSAAGGEGLVSIFLLMTGIILGAVRILFFQETARFSIPIVVELVIYSIACWLANLFWEAGVNRGDIVLAGVMAYSAPFLSTVFTGLYLGVAVGWKIWVGCGLLIAGAVLCKKGVKETTE